MGLGPQKEDFYYSEGRPLDHYRFKPY